jgi:hypothetical protein
MMYRPAQTMVEENYRADQLDTFRHALSPVTRKTTPTACNIRKLITGLRGVLMTAQSKGDADQRVQVAARQCRHGIACNTAKRACGDRTLSAVPKRYRQQGHAIMCRCERSACVLTCHGVGHAHSQRGAGAGRRQEDEQERAHEFTLPVRTSDVSCTIRCSMFAWFNMLLREQTPGHQHLGAPQWHARCPCRSRCATAAAAGSSSRACHAPSRVC